MSDIRHLTSDVWHHISVIRCLTSNVCHQTSVITRLTSDICHQTSGIRHLSSDIWHQTSDIIPLPTDVWHQTSVIFWWATCVGKMAYLACLGSPALSCSKRLWSGQINTKFFIVWSRWLNVLWEQNRPLTSFWMSFLQKDKVGLCFRHHVKIFHLLRKLFMALTFSEINLQVSNTILMHQWKKDGVDEANQN